MAAAMGSGGFGGGEAAAQRGRKPGPRKGFVRLSKDDLESVLRLRPHLSDAGYGKLLERIGDEYGLPRSDKWCVNLVSGLIVVAREPGEAYLPLPKDTEDQ